MVGLSDTEHKINMFNMFREIQEEIENLIKGKTL